MECCSEFQSFSSPVNDSHLKCHTQISDLSEAGWFRNLFRDLETACWVRQASVTLYDFCGISLSPSSSSGYAS